MINSLVEYKFFNMNLLHKMRHLYLYISLQIFMKKTFILALLVGTLGFSACSEDDDDPAPTNTNTAGFNATELAVFGTVDTIQWDGLGTTLVDGNILPRTRAFIDSTGPYTWEIETRSNDNRSEGGPRLTIRWTTATLKDTTLTATATGLVGLSFVSYTSSNSTLSNVRRNGEEYTFDFTFKGTGTIRDTTTRFSGASLTFLNLKAVRKN